MMRVLRYVVLAFFALLWSWPFLWMLGTALHSLPEAAGPTLSPWPGEFHWENFVSAWHSAPFGRYFINTIFVSTTVAFIVAFTSLTAAYAFSHLRFRGRDALFMLVLTTMMVPFEAILIPNFVLIGRFGWYNTFAALIIPWSANAFSIFLLRQALLGLPSEISDAARIDGCGHLLFLFRVAAPLIRPALTTVILVAFLGSYNALLWPLIVTSDDEHRMLQAGLLAFASDAGVRLNLLMCASTIIILPTVILFIIFQRHYNDAPSVTR